MDVFNFGSSNLIKSIFVCTFVEKVGSLFFFLFCKENKFLTLLSVFFMVGGTLSKEFAGNLFKTISLKN